MLRLKPVKHKYCYLSENPPGLNLLCAFSTRISGNTSLLYGDTDNALDNRKNFLKGLGIDYRDLVCAKQVHGSLSRYIQDGDMGRGALSYDSAIPDADALITDKKNVPLSIFTADCLSVFLYDPKVPGIGLLHAGWRSSREEVAAKAIQLMRGKFNTKAENLYALLGPAIRDCCYEVGKEFIDFFTPEYLIERNGSYYLDLAGMNKKQLLAQGVKDENIFDSKICTACRNEEFFSYRKEGGNCGRIMSVMMLK
ncbi:MAG: peptidoglycan editing factor PgeF [Candidatus Omnitrophota bacterium]